MGRLPATETFEKRLAVLSTDVDVAIEMPNDERPNDERMTKLE
jgi:hypothetical protein